MNESKEEYCHICKGKIMTDSIGWRVCRECGRWPGVATRPAFAPVVDSERYWNGIANQHMFGDFGEIV